MAKSSRIDDLPDWGAPAGEFELGGEPASCVTWYRWRGDRDALAAKVKAGLLDKGWRPAVLPWAADTDGLFFAKGERKCMVALAARGDPGTWDVTVLCDRSNR